MAFDDLTSYGHDLIQADTNYSPTWSATGLLFDGSDDFIKADAFTSNQPTTVYLVAKQITWTSGDYLIDGNTSDDNALICSSSEANIWMWAGAYGGYRDATLGTWFIITAQYNGASSMLQLNNADSTVADASTNNAGGFTLGGAAGSSGAANIEVKAVIVRNFADDYATRQAIKVYLNNKYSIY